MFEDIIEDICDILDIEMPDMIFDDSEFEGLSETLLAMYDPEENIIYVREDKADSIDMLLIVAHELRHVWQVETGDSRFTETKTRDEFDNVDDYARQFAEVDANAFAIFITAYYYNAVPTFDMYSDETRQMIANRAREIAREYAE